MTRAAGVLLFLPVPLVLWLLTRTPLGAGASLALAIALVGTHRLYARPFALQHALERCLWCGGSATGPERIDVVEPFGPTTWSACCGRHADRARRTCAFLGAHAVGIRVGVLGSLLLLVVVEALVAAHVLGEAALGHAVAAFRIGIALTVLPVGFLAPRFPPSDSPPRVAFPVHIQALIGTHAVLWLFRLVGIVWLVLGLAHVASILPGSP